MSGWRDLAETARDEVRRTVKGLPAPLRAHAEKLPTTYERVPKATLQEDGIASDTLGLFVGEPLADAGATTAPLPAQIILFIENLWDCAEGDPEIFREEVRATYLHELGHYLGLDEAELDDRGLG